MYKLVLIMLLSSQFLLANHPIWGKTGHRVTAEIAQRYLSKKASKAIDKILNGQSLAEVSNYADDIKSDIKFRSFSPWHYVNLPKDIDYRDIKPSPSGDIIIAIQYCISVLENDSSSMKDRVFYLKMLVHFVGDLHQPLHIGRKKDRGGNDIQVRWFEEGSNLHRVWDSDMIDKYGMSYTELANKLTEPSKTKVKNLQSGDIYAWVKETREITNQIYDSVNVGQKLSYGYSYTYWPIVEQQLLVGGIRLAGIINKIYG